MVLHTKKRIMILEQNVSGHRLYYVRLIVEEINRQDGVAILVTAPNASSTPEWTTHLSGHMGSFELIMKPVLTASSLGKLAQSLGVGHIVVPDGDRMCMEIGRSRNWTKEITVSILVMREFAQSSKFKFLERLKQFVKTNLITSASTVPGVRVLILKSALWAGKTKHDIVQDPVTLLGFSCTRSEVLERYDLNPELYWFSVTGAISTRKNLPIIVDALTGLRGHNIGLLIAGTISPEVRAQLGYFQECLGEAKIDMRVHDALLNDEEFDCLIRSVDCVILAHSNEGPSGIMGKAALAGTRVVAAGALTLQADCAAVPDLATWTDLNVEGLRNCFSKSIVSDRPVPIEDLSARRFASALV